MNYASLFQKLDLTADLECNCPEGILRVESQPEERRVVCSFSNNATFRYALRSYPGVSRSDLNRLQESVDASGIGLDVLVEDRSVMALAPNQSPTMELRYLIGQFLRARFLK